MITQLRFPPNLPKCLYNIVYIFKQKDFFKERISFVKLMIFRF